MRSCIAPNTAQDHLKGPEGLGCIENSSRLFQESHFSLGQPDVGEMLLQFFR